MRLSRLLSLLHSHGLRPVCPSRPLTPDNNRAFSTARPPPPTAWMFSLDCNVLYEPQSWWRCCGNPSRSAVPFRPRSDARSQPQLLVLSRRLVSPRWPLSQMSLNDGKKKKIMCELLNLGGKKKLRLTPCYYSKHILRPTQELHSCQSDKPLRGQSVFLTKAFTLQYQRQTGAQSLGATTCHSNCTSVYSQVKWVSVILTLG